MAFADTIKMSTYLVAFVVGELEAHRPGHGRGRRPCACGACRARRAWPISRARPGPISLGFFESYYGLPYPGDKLDLLAIPDFAAGAMENLGAITFRETALLVDERQATHNELERIADVVAHENAHMWFGDLVTMSWWNGIWLNEAFATFMEMLAVDAWKPEWKRWNTFGVSRAAAFGVDGLWSTRPIEFEVKAPRDADAMFDVLTYEKGASVLRMLEQYLGAEVFRAGVREYLRAHAYANADTGDLWAALGRAAGTDIPAVMDALDLQPGLPPGQRPPRGQPSRADPAALHLPARAARVRHRERQLGTSAGRSRSGSASRREARAAWSGCCWPRARRGSPCPRASHGRRQRGGPRLLPCPVRARSAGGPGPRGSRRWPPSSGSTSSGTPGPAPWPASSPSPSTWSWPAGFRVSATGTCGRCWWRR